MEKEMKTIVTIFLIALLVLAGLLVMRIGKRTSGPPPIEYNSTLQLDRLEDLSELVSLRVQISDVLRAETKGVKAAFLIAGDALISVDMGSAEIVGEDTETRVATILLPEPKVLTPRVDHRRTCTYDVQKSLFTRTRVESRVRDEAMGKAQSLVEQAANSADNITLAKSNAEKTLRLLCKQLGWDVEIRWRADMRGNGHDQANL